MLLIDSLSRIVHVSTAIAVAGGSIFMLLVLLPAAKQLPQEAHDTLSAAVTSRWKRIVHLGITLFLLSGFYNYATAMDSHKGDGLYHGLIGTKILLALIIFFVASALVGRSARFESMRQNKSKWLKLIVGLVLVIVAISGFVKVRQGYLNRPATTTTLSANLTE